MSMYQYVVDQPICALSPFKQVFSQDETHFSSAACFAYVVLCNHNDADQIASKC